MIEAPDIDLLLEGPDFYADPYPAYARLRAESPVHWHAPTRTWLVSRYEDAEAVLREPEIFSSVGSQAKMIELLPAELRDAVPTFRRRGRVLTLISSDPPEHTRLRRFLQVFFSARAIEMLRRKVEAISAELLESVAGRRLIDVVDTLAFPLPATILAELIGVPAEGRGLLREASTNFVRFINRSNPTLELTVEVARDAERSLSTFADYLGG